MRVIVCGSRGWEDADMIDAVLSQMKDENPDVEITIIQGASKGADKIAATIARELGMKVESFPADWNANGKAAGPIRNQQMLDSGCDKVLAFKDGFKPESKKGGTENMANLAWAAGLSVFVHAHL